MTQTIMVIDDEIEILDMLKRYFSLEGYHVITAAGGKEALQKLSKQPDLILLDINMPDIDGLSLCKSIRDFVSRILRTATKSKALAQVGTIIL